MPKKSSADILYVPSLHLGYVNFLAQREGCVGVLDQGLVQETPRLDLDIRAIAAPLMTKIIAVAVPNRNVELVTEASLDAFLEPVSSVSMPDEDVSHTFAARHLAPRGIDAEFIRTFLRWDKQISTTEFEIPPDRIIGTEEAERALMAIASEEAQKAPDWWRQIGALIVVGDKIILKGHNHPYPTEHGTLETFGDPRSNFEPGKNIELQRNIHAEAGLIAKAARWGIALEGADLYVTTFPCPVCAKSVAAAGIKRVFYKQGYSLLDAEYVLRSQGVEIVLVRD